MPGSHQMGWTDYRSQPYGIADQEAPKAHAQEEAQEDVEAHAFPAS
jgi:hypothetical protein